jgi:Copper amine oxidase N-terminal domain
LRVRLGALGTTLALALTAQAPALAAATASAPAVVAQTAATAAPDFGAAPSGEVPILFNDRHVYAKPDRLKQGRVLAALVKGGTVLVPLRSMFEQTGATVSWDPATKTVDVTKPGADVRVTVGKPEVVINGESRPLDVPPEVYQGAVVVPLRVISEGMGAYVQWVPDKRLVVVRYIPAAPPTAPPPTPVPTVEPTSAPTATPSPSPSPKPPYYSRYIAGDYVIAPKVYNELSSGNNGNGSWAVHGAIEQPVAKLPLMVSADFRQFQYGHQSNFGNSSCVPTQTSCGTVVGGNPNYRSGTCPSSDPGCVTVIGSAAYQAVTGSGQAYVPAFTAQDRDFDVSLGYKIADPRIYLAPSYYWRTYNYLGYPTLQGLGFGVEKLADTDQPWSLYGSAYFYPSVKGNYTGPTTPLLGSLSGATFDLQYRVIRYAIGGTYNFGTTPLYADVGFLGDQGFNKNNAPSDFTHSGAYVGLGLHF